MGYFHKIFNSDIFVLFDDAKYSKNSYINRNKIKIPDGELWLTVPVTKESHNLSIKYVKIADNNWRGSHLKNIINYYKKTDYFHELETLFYKIYKSDWIKLNELNEFIIKNICSELMIETNILKSSDLNIKDEINICSICEKLNADAYLSGIGGKKYMEEKGLLDCFNKFGIDVKYQKFEFPIYKQKYGDFIPNLSIIDTLCNIGIDKTYSLINA